jgi:hypothetical protein
MAGHVTSNALSVRRRAHYAKRAVRRLPSLLPRALTQSAGYEGFLSCSTSAWIIDAYCSSLVVNAFL